MTDQKLKPELPDHPAHPWHGKMARGLEEFPHHFPGLSKREHFAGLALHGLIVNPPWPVPAGPITPADYASRALELADALLVKLAG